MELRNNLVIDYDTFKAALTEILLEDSDTFRSLYPGSTANIFVECLSGYAAMLMYRLQTAITNSFLKTAFSEYSIFSIAEMLGVIIRGNTGSKVDVVLERQPFTSTPNLPAFTIPQHTGFTINNLPFYNRETLTFPSSYTQIETTLYQGEIKQKEYTTTGAMNEKFLFGDSFTVDISYVTVLVNGVEWKTDYETIMDYTVGEENSTDSVQVVLLRTNVDGTCYIQFGNGIYGALPPAGSIVQILYATTVGAVGNFTGAQELSINDNLLSDNIEAPEILQVSGARIGAATDGSNRLSASSLKYVSPRLFASNNRAVKRSDYIGQMIYNCNYKDCNFWGEYEQAKKEGYADNSMMNRVYYTAITNDFSVNTVVFTTGDGVTKEFTKNVSSIVMFPGSVEVKSDTETFRDYNGMGYMFSEASDYTIQKSLGKIVTTDEDDSATGETVSTDTTCVVQFNLLGSIGETNLNIDFSQSMKCVIDVTGEKHCKLGNRTFTKQIDGKTYTFTFDYNDRRILTDVEFKGVGQEFGYSTSEMSVAVTEKSGSTVKTVNDARLKVLSIQYITGSSIVYDKTEVVTTEFDVKTSSSGNFSNTTITVAWDDPSSESVDGSLQITKTFETFLSCKFDESGVPHCWLGSNKLEKEFDGKNYVFEFLNKDGTTLSDVEFIEGQLFNKDSMIYVKGEIQTFTEEGVEYETIENANVKIVTVKFVERDIGNILIQKESVEDELMSNANTYYQSSQAPTSSHPIVIDFSFDKPIALAGIRFFSSSFSTAEDRCFPSKIIVLGWRGGEDGTDPVNLPLEDFESSDENKAWNFKELMHDTRWEHLTEAVSLSEPGVSAWSDWVGLDTSANEKTFTYIKDGAPVTSKKQNVFKLYRLIVLDRFGASEEQSIKIGKVALITKAKSSLVNYEDGNAIVKFKSAPAVDEVIYATTIGEKLSDYQKLRDYAFLKKINHFTTEVEYKDLKLKRVDIDVKVIYSNSTDVSTLKSNVEEAITNLFAVTQGRIGQSLRVSTLYSTIMGVEGVVYCIKKLPVDDIEINVDEILYLSKLNIEYESAARLGN